MGAMMGRMELRLATSADVAAVDALVQRAFAVYVPRMGCRPAPMDEDYAALAAAGSVWVLDAGGGAIVGCVVLTEAPGALLVDDLAVEPERQGAGLGRRLLEHAEARARVLGLPELQLYTNEKMVENQAIYPRLGWTETDRATSRSGFRRVHYRKPTPPA